jgi:hypothetical protein
VTGDLDAGKLWAICLRERLSRPQIGTVLSIATIQRPSLLEPFDVLSNVENVLIAQRLENTILNTGMLSNNYFTGIVMTPCVRSFSIFSL